MLGRPAQADLVAFGHRRHTGIGLGQLHRSEGRIDLEQPVITDENTGTDTPP